jgi:hypothetical protein
LNPPRIKVIFLPEKSAAIFVIRASLSCGILFVKIKKPQAKIIA